MSGFVSYGGWLCATLRDRHQVISQGDIAIRPFRLEADGVVFGLVVGGDEEYEWATLEPDDLFFTVPWDGSDST